MKEGEERRRRGEGQRGVREWKRNPSKEGRGNVVGLGRVVRSREGGWTRREREPAMQNRNESRVNGLSGDGSRSTNRMGINDDVPVPETQVLLPAWMAEVPRARTHMR